MSTAKLIVSQPGRRSRSIELQTSTTSIGRRPDNTLCLEGDDRVSKYHAIIENRNGEYWISDLSSRNGTTVNDEPISHERKLNNDDIICVGGASTLEFQLSKGAPAGTEGAAPANFDISSIRAPSHPSLNVPRPSVPSTSGSIPSIQTPTMPNASRFLGMRPRVAAIVGGGLLIGVISVSALTLTGAFSGSQKSNERSSAETASQVAPNPGSNSETTSQQVDQPTTVVEPPALPEPTAVVRGAGAADVNGALARNLAAQIAQKSSYSFDPAFVNVINQYTNEYRAAGDYYDRASKYREAVDREFINAQGIQPPLIGYLVAMSQTKFIDKPNSVWALPPAIIKEYQSGNEASFSDPDVSTKIAASYLRSLLDLFERENFMYAVACYGMTLDQAGKVRTELEKKDPGGQNRYDFWKMKNAGVVQGDQVERVARFFAAGIVTENPEQFGLKQKRLSSL
jgi:FHA domain